MPFEKCEFSRNDIRKQIVVPKFISVELAELVGILIGDGHVAIEREKSNKAVGYRVGVSANADTDSEYIFGHVLPLFKKLFNAKPYVRRRRGRELEIMFSSKVMTTYFINTFQIPNNKSNVDVPDVIKLSNEEHVIAFLRGLFDTDGSLSIKKKYRNSAYYPVINFSTKSPNLFESVKTILKTRGFVFSANARNKPDKRNGKVYRFYQLDISGELSFQKWIEEIGFNNPKNLEKIKLVGRKRFELSTSTLSAWRANQVAPPALEQNSPEHFKKVDAPDEI